MSDSVKAATDFLKKIEGYECKEILGKGTYGTVIKISKGDTTKAAKICENRVVNILEIREWPKLKHENVLGLLDTILNAEGAVIFITEMMESNLFVLLQNKDFKKDVQALENCRLFARQIYSGMSYLHSLKLCHLDLRAENVFVTSNKRVVVADFSGLAHIDDMKKFCPLPNSLRPPEMLISKKIKVAPLPVDLWACGLILAHMFLGRGYYIITVKNTKAGHIEAVNQYTECFSNKKYVTPFITQNYPNSNIPDNKIFELITLISMFLRITPSARLTADEAIQHSFLTMPLTAKPAIISMTSSVKLTSEEISTTSNEENSNRRSETKSSLRLKKGISSKKIQQSKGRSLSGPNTDLVWKISGSCTQLLYSNPKNTSVIRSRQSLRTNL